MNVDIILMISCKHSVKSVKGFNLKHVFAGLSIVANHG